MGPERGIRIKDRFSSIRTRMLLSFAFLFIVTLTMLELSHIYGIPFTDFKGEYAIEQNEVLTELELLADLKKSRLEELLNEMRSDITIFSENELVSAHVSTLVEMVRRNIENGMSGATLRTEIEKLPEYGKLSEYLSLITNTYANYDQTIIFDLETGMIIAGSRGGKTGNNIYDDSGFDSGFLENEFKKNRVSFYLGPDEADHHVDLNIYAPVLDEGGIRAVFMVDVNTDEVIVPMLHTGEGLGKSGEALLVDNHARVIMPLKYPLPDGTSAEPLKFEIKARPAVLSSLGEEGMIAAKDYRGIDVLAAYRYIRFTTDRGWGMVVKKDRSEVFAKFNEVKKYSVIVGAFAVVFFGTSIILIVQRITKPLIGLSEHARNIGEGNLDIELRAESNDEVGRLTREFNEMRLKLKESYSGLEEKVREKTDELAAALSDARKRNIELSETKEAMLNLVEDLELEVEGHKRSKEKIRKQLEKLNALREIDFAIASNFELSVVLNVFLEHAVAQLHADAIDIMILNQDTMTVDHCASKGFLTEHIKKASMQLGEGYAGYIALEREPVQELELSNISQRCRRFYLLSDEGFRTYFGVPLISKGTVKGVLEVFHRSEFRPDSEWHAFMESLAGQAAIAIDNSAMFNEVQRANEELLVGYETTIEGWARALDYRDKETEGHSRRVTDMSVKIAMDMGIESADLVNIRRGALLHDIGKLGIPDSVLFKQGSLSEEEWELMSRHPVIAYKIISPIPFLRPALDIPLYHHEKWDGSGYPQGLRGELIPVAARIFAVVDVWDALTSERPYRPAWSGEEAKEYIRSLAGVHFDPGIVKAFLSMELERG